MDSTGLRLMARQSAAYYFNRRNEIKTPQIPALCPSVMYCSPVSTFLGAFFHKGVRKHSVIRIIRMCYHYSIPDLIDLQGRFNINTMSAPEIRRIYHVSAFTNPLLPVITNHDPNTIQLFQWGLIPFWITVYDTIISYEEIV